MRRGEILLMSPVLAHLAGRLAVEHAVYRLWEADDREARLTELAGRVTALGTNAFLGADAALIDRFPKLELIASFGVGLDTFDLGHASARGVRVTHTPGVLDDDVADLAFGLLLACSRQLARGDRYVRAGRWPEGDFPLGRKLSGSRLGILGLGRIGKALARRAAAFGMAIHYHGRRPQTDQPYTYHADPVALATAVDHLVVLVPGDAATRGLVGREVLAALGPQGTLVNVARGSVVDETALVEMLVAGQLGAAGLDVFANEPHVPEALFVLDNVVLLPHQGSATRETRAAMGELVLANIIAHFAGEPLPSPAN